MAFPGELSDLLIERDRQGSARQLRHLLPFASTRTTPREVALAYLEEIVAFNRNNPPHQSLYPIEPKDLRHLSRTIGEAEGPASQSKNAELRWRPDRVIRRTVSGQWFTR